MKKTIGFFLLILISAFVNAQKVIEWISTTKTEQWQTKKYVENAVAPHQSDVVINVGSTLQTVVGFGTCFNELGWTSLSLLGDRDKQNIFKELFAPGVGANFTICRMPVGANDFSRNWYSFDEKEGDFSMTDFNIENDLETLVPYIKNAQKYNPTLKFWASPWSPPSWMKYNKHYALKSLQKGITNMKSGEYGIDFNGLDNGLKPGLQGKEGTDMFIQEDKYFKAYTLYFAKFIQAYKAQNINIGMVMPQNEFNSAQPFPSCTWTANGLAKFVGYLAPQMNALGVEVFFGTMERPNAKLVDTILTNNQSKGFIKGIGFQWAGKDAIPTIHKNYPNLALYQSEQECGNGNNDWEYAKYAWGLMKHYFNNGVSAYMYWNTSLIQGSISRWGWKQNSLVSVNPKAKSYKYNYDYYVMKHVSHYVKPGAKMLTTTGAFNNLLAFLNPDKSVVVVIKNDRSTQGTVRIGIGNKFFGAELAADSFNTLVFK